MGARRERRPRRWWERHLERWKRSGLSQAEYCRRHGLASVSLSGWKRRVAVREGQAGRVSSRVPFVPVEVKGAERPCGSPAGVWACEIVGAQGVRLRLRERPGLRRLERLLSGLGGGR